jgi:predicted nucleotidyltransferase
VNVPALESRLVAQLREIDAALRAAGIRYVLIGGVAVNIHGYLRATRDLDLMMLVEDAQQAHEVFTGLGYETIDRREDIASYVRDTARLNVIYARRPISRRLFERPREATFCKLRLSAISVEGLLGLKIQAFSDDSRRLDDLKDMIELVKLHRESLDLDEVRSYFRLFNQERVLDDILRAIG